MWGRGNRGGRAWGLYGRGGGWRTQIGRGSDPGRVVARGVRSRIAASGVRARRGKGKGGLAAEARAIDPDCHLGLHAPSIRQIAIHGYHSSHRELWQKTGDVMPMTPPSLFAIPAVTPATPYARASCPLLDTTATTLHRSTHSATEASEPAQDDLPARARPLSEAPPTPPPSLSASFPLLSPFPAHRLCLLQPMSWAHSYCHISTAVIYGVLRCLTICFRTDRTCQSHHRLLSVCVYAERIPSTRRLHLPGARITASATLTTPCTYRSAGSGARGSAAFCRQIPAHRPRRTARSAGDRASPYVLGRHVTEEPRAGGCREPWVAAGHQASGLGRNCQGASRPPPNRERVDSAHQAAERQTH